MEDSNVNSNKFTKEYDHLMKEINSILEIICGVVLCFIVYVCIKIFITSYSIVKYFLIGILSIIMLFTIKTIKNHNTHRSVSNHMRFERWLIHLLWFFNRDDLMLDAEQEFLDDNPNIDWYVYGSIPVYVMIRLGYMLLIIAMYLFLVDYNLILAIICAILGTLLIILPRYISIMVINKLADKVEEKNSVDFELADKRKSSINYIILLLTFVPFIIVNAIYYKQIGIKNLLLLDLLAITIIFSICYIIDSITKSIRLNKKIRKYKKKKELNKDGKEK